MTPADFTLGSDLSVYLIYPVGWDRATGSYPALWYQDEVHLYQYPKGWREAPILLYTYNIMYRIYYSISHPARCKRSSGQDDKSEERRLDSLDRMELVFPCVEKTYFAT